MLTPITEFFNGGLVTSRHPAFLAPGELARTDDCVYRENDPSIWRAPGRVQYTSAAQGEKIKGLAYLSYDKIYADRLLLSSGSSLYSAPTTDVTTRAMLAYGAGSTVTPSVILGQSSRYCYAASSTTIKAQIRATPCALSSGGVLTATGSGQSTFVGVQVGDVVTGITGVTNAVVTVVTSYLSLTITGTGIAAQTGQTCLFTPPVLPFTVASVGLPLILFLNGIQIPKSFNIIGYADQAGSSGTYLTATFYPALSAAEVTALGAGSTYPSLTYVVRGGSSNPLTDTGSEVLDCLQYGSSRHYLWNGHDPLQALEWRTRTSIPSDPTSLPPVLTLRPAGMKPVTASFKVVLTDNGTVGWNTDRGPGSYWFLVTEIYSPLSSVEEAERDPILKNSVRESIYLGVDPTAKDVQGSKGLPLVCALADCSDQSFTIHFPSANNYTTMKVANDGVDGYLATHWGVYISGPYAERPSLATMRRCATVPIDATRPTVGLSDVITSQGDFYPSVVAAAPGGYPSFQNSAAFVSLCDSNYATSGVAHEGMQTGANTLSSFKNSVGASPSVAAPYDGSVYGIEVRIRAYADPSRGAGPSTGIMFYLYSTTSPAVYTGQINGIVTMKNAYYQTFGGPADRLGVPWTPAHIPTLKIDLYHTSTGGEQHLFIDSVSLRIYYQSKSVNFDGPAYRVVTFQDQIGTTVSEPARNLPPACSTGDFFQGSLVLNDLTDPTRICYSLPGDPESFPKPYFLAFNSRKKDEVTFIRTIGPNLVVGLKNGIKRVNWLPRETDTDMNSSEAAHEDIVIDHGIPGSNAATRFDLPGVGIVLAYASTVGCFITNGIWTRPINLDLKWDSLVKISALPTCVMRAYPKEKWIAFYYCPAGATHNSNTRVLYFCYQSDKIKTGGLLPAVGPVIASGRSVTEGTVNGTSCLFTGHEHDGLVYLEDTGTVIPAQYQVIMSDQETTHGNGKTGTSGTDVTINPLIRTRRLYPSGIENYAREERILLLYEPYGTAITISGISTTLGSAVISVLNADVASILLGTTVTGTGIDPGVLVLSKGTPGGTVTPVTLSRASNTTSTSVALSFDTGTLGITVRGTGIGEAVVGCDTQYASTLLSDLLRVHNDNSRQGLEIQFEKVPLTFDSNHLTTTSADLGVNMRLHQFTVLVSNEGLD
jgi:hypothetical protein